MAQTWVREVEPVTNASTLRAVFTVEVEGVGRIERCRYLETTKSAFVTGPSYRDPFSLGGWAQPVTFEPDVAAALLETVRERLAQDESR